jgi:hypothetical protein
MKAFEGSRATKRRGKLERKHERRKQQRTCETVGFLKWNQMGKDVRDPTDNRTKELVK